MISKYQYKNITWIDLNSPSKEELSSVTDQFTLPSVLVDQLAISTPKPRIDIHPNLVYFVLNFPSSLQIEKLVSQEIDFIVGKNFLITAHYGTIEALEQFASRFESNSEYAKQNMGDHAGFVFFYLIKELYQKTNLNSQNIDILIQEVEKGIFVKHTNETIKNISRINKLINDIKQLLAPHYEILKSFETAGKNIFGNDFERYTFEISSEYTKLTAKLNDYCKLLDNLMTINNSLVTSKVNKSIKILAVITGILGVNIIFVLALSTKNFTTTIAGVFVLTIFLLLFVKIKKWL